MQHQTGPMIDDGHWSLLLLLFLQTNSPNFRNYRVAQNQGKQVLRITNTILSFLDEIASASQQLPFFTKFAQLPLLSKVSCSDLFAHEEWQQTDWIIGKWNFICEILKTCLPWFCATLYSIEVFSTKFST